MLHLSFAILGIFCNDIQREYRAQECCGHPTGDFVPPSEWSTCEPHALPDVANACATKTTEGTTFNISNAYVMWQTMLPEIVDPLTNRLYTHKMHWGSVMIDEEHVYGQVQYRPNTARNSEGFGMAITGPSSPIQFGVRTGHHSGSARGTFTSTTGGPGPGPGANHAGDAYIFKMKKCTGRLVEFKTLREIGASVNEGYPKPIELVNCPHDGSGNCVGRIDGRLTSTRSMILSQDGAHLYVPHSSVFSAGVAKIRTSNLTLVWYHEIDDFTNLHSSQYDDAGKMTPQRISEFSTKDIIEIMDRVDGLPILVVGGSPAASAGYHAAFRRQNFEQFNHHYWKEGVGAVVALKDTGLSALRMWTFKVAPEHLRNGSMFPEESFAPDQTFLRVWYPANNLDGVILSTTTQLGGVDGVTAQTTGRQKVVFGDVVIDGWDAMSGGTDLAPINSTYRANIWWEATSGYVDFNEGDTLRRSTLLPMYVEYKAVSRRKIIDTSCITGPDCVYARIRDSRDRFNESYFEVDQITGYVSVYARYLFDKKHPVIVRIERNETGKRLDADLAHNLNYYGAGVWGVFAYDEEKDIIINGGANMYRYPLEEEIRNARLRLCLPEEGIPSSWGNSRIPCGLGDDTLFAPPELGPYGSETNLWYDSWEAKARRYGNGTIDTPDSEFTYMQVSEHMWDVYQASLRDYSARKTYLGMYTAQQHRIRDAQHSPRANRFFSQGFFELDVRTGRLMNAHRAVYDDMIMEFGFSQAAISAGLWLTLAQGMNFDYSSVSINPSTRTAMHYLQMGTQLVHELDGPVITCVDSSGMCDSGISERITDSVLQKWQFAAYGTNYDRYIPWKDYFVYSITGVEVHVCRKCSLVYTWDAETSRARLRYSNATSLYHLQQFMPPGAEVQGSVSAPEVWLNGSDLNFIFVINATTGEMLYEKFLENLRGPNNGQRAIVQDNFMFIGGKQLLQIDMDTLEVEVDHKFRSKSKMTLRVEGDKLWAAETRGYPDAAEPSLEKFSVSMRMDSESANSITDASMYTDEQLAMISNYRFTELATALPSIGIPARQAGELVDAEFLLLVQQTFELSFEAVLQLALNIGYIERIDAR